MMGLQVLMERYGQGVTLCYESGEQLSLRAFLQPILKKADNRWQVEASPLGMDNQDTYLYLGPADTSLEELGEGYLLWRDLPFEVTQVQPIYVGEQISHWWATLRQRGGVA